MIASIGREWHRFWFEPHPVATMVIVRIAYGFVLLAWACTMAPDVLAFHGNDGVLPEPASFRHTIGLLDVNGSDAMVIGVMVALVAAAFCLMIGYRSQLAAIVAFVMVVSLRDRNPWHISGGDGLIRNFAFFMMFVPSSLAVSVGAWRRGRSRFWSFPDRAPWPLRLMQVQVAIVYVFTTWAKARGENWWSGTASGNVMHVEDLERLRVPDFIQNSLLVSNALSWGTLVVELALGILIWNRRWRPYVIAAGVVLHLFIEVTMQLGFFSSIMIVGYLTFIPEETAVRWLGRVRAWAGRSRFSPLRRLAEVDEPEQDVAAPAADEPRAPAPVGAATTSR